ncbi:unnamed protein product, partial [Rangifer tarandus platyrhynchus]
MWMAEVFTPQRSAVGKEHRSVTAVTCGLLAFHRDCLRDGETVDTHFLLPSVKSILACEIPKPGEFRSSPDEDDLQDNRDQAEEKV